MAVTINTYAKGLEEIMKGNIHFDTDSIKVALLTSSYSTNLTLHEHLDDVNSNEISDDSGYGYTAGGESISGLEVNYETGTVYVEATSSGDSDVEWGSLTAATLRYAIVYKNTGTASSSVLLFVINFGETYNLSSQDFAIRWTAGVLCSLAKKA